MAIVKCKNCGKETFNHSRGMCITCYKKLMWKPKIILCKRCGKDKPHHEKGYCKNCSTILFHYDLIKKHNYRKGHNIDLETYNKLTQKCEVCGFDKAVDLHHLDQNKKNNSEANMVGLCPNHHKMIHMPEYREEILRGISENRKPKT